MISPQGKACQKAHRPVHRADCEHNIRVKECARSFGSEMEAKQASYTQWCENNSPAFARAAFAALGICSRSDKQNACQSESLCRLEPSESLTCTNIHQMNTFFLLLSGRTPGRTTSQTSSSSLIRFSWHPNYPGRPCMP
jgi:hypothetical protein